MDVGCNGLPQQLSRPAPASVFSLKLAPLSTASRAARDDHWRAAQAGRTLAFPAAAAAAAAACASRRGHPGGGTMHPAAPFARLASSTSSSSGERRRRNRSSSKLRSHWPATTMPCCCTRCRPQWRRRASPAAAGWMLLQMGKRSAQRCSCRHPRQQMGAVRHRRCCTHLWVLPPAVGQAALGCCCRTFRALEQRTAAGS